MEKSNIMFVGEVARFLRFSADWVRVLADRGVLRAERAHNGQRVFLREDVERFAKEREAHSA